MSRDSDTVAIAQLTAEVMDDLLQMARTAERLAARLDALEQPRCNPETSAFVAVGLHRWYTAAEAAFERVERVLVGSLPTGDRWHQDLLRLMSLEIPNLRPPVLTPELATRLVPYLRFRHFLRHAYATDFEPTKLAPLVRDLPAVQLELEELLKSLLRSFGQG